MTIELYPHSIIYFIAVIFAFITALYIWFQQKVPGGKLIALFMLLFSEWSFALFMESIVLSIPKKIFWSRIEYIGYSFASPILILFATQYVLSNVTKKRIPKTFLWGIWLLPIINLILAWTNSLHGWVWKDFVMDPAGLNHLIYIHGFWARIFLGYFALLLIIANCIFLYAFKKSKSKQDRTKYGLIIIGSLFSLLAGLIYSANIFPLPALNMIPIGCIIDSLIIWFAISRYGLISPKPAAQLRLVEILSEGIIVLDHEDIVVSSNPAAIRILGETIAEGTPSPSTLMQIIKTKTEKNIEYYQRRHGDYYLHVNSEDIFDSNMAFIGRLIVIRDMTNFYQLEMKLQKEEMSKAVLEERQRLARNLHDSIFQSLSSLTLSIDYLKNSLKTSKEQSIEKLIDVIEESSIQALREMRLVVFELIPFDENQSFEKMLKKRVAGVEERAKLTVYLDLQSKIELPANTQKEFWYFTNEALNNIIKHAYASEIQVRLAKNSQSIVLSVSDNGVGLENKSMKPGGIGFINMEKRAEILGGEFKLESALHEGTRVSLVVPIREE